MKGYPILFFFAVFSTAYCGFGQVQPITVYYDDDQQQVKEVYFLSDSLPVLDGPYKSYYASGAIKSSGYFNNGTPSGEWKYYFENGNLKMGGPLENGTNHGQWKYYYENGQISMMGNIFDGARQGHWKHFYENGKIKSEGAYLDGKKNGLWNYYYEDGTLRAQATHAGGKGWYQEYYTSGELLAEGLNRQEKSDSLWTYYYENGKVKAQGNYTEGLKTGHWKFYFPEGSISSEGNYIEGQPMGNWVYYYRDGSKSSEGVSYQGKKDGYWKLYYKNGGLMGEGFFDQGTGEYKEYYESGKLKVSGHIEDGKNNGKWLYYYEDGNREGVANFTAGKGWFKGFYKDGTLKMEGTLEDGIRTGTWKLYKRDGQLAGYYKSVYGREAPGFEEIEIPLAMRLDSLNDTINYEKPEYRFKSNKSRYFSRRLNEFRGLVIATNPVAMTVGSVPFAVEYYMQERLGYELQYTYIRDPFFTSDSNILPLEIYNRGYSIAIRQKFYHDDQSWGMWYFGHELRFTSVGHFANINGLGQYHPLKSVSENEEKFEYSLFVGDRLLRNAGERGITADIFLGIGVGYRNREANYSEEKYNQLFHSLPDATLSIPLRLGINLGYIF